MVWEKWKGGHTKLRLSRKRQWEAGQTNGSMLLAREWSDDRIEADGVDSCVGVTWQGQEAVGRQ
jgi:hypothetical protein